MGELVSVKLPMIAVSLRVVEISTGKVSAATDVVGEVGERGEAFFVLVDQAAFGIFDALQVKLGTRDRIELGQVAVKQFDTVEAYGRALAALHRGDSATALDELDDALDDATEAREAHARCEAFQSRYKLPKADRSYLREEGYAVQGVVAVDPAFRLVRACRPHPGRGVPYRPSVRRLRRLHAGLPRPRAWWPRDDVEVVAVWDGSVPAIQVLDPWGTIWASPRRGTGGRAPWGHEREGHPRTARGLRVGDRRWRGSPLDPARGQPLHQLLLEHEEERHHRHARDERPGRKTTPLGAELADVPVEHHR